MQVKYLPKSFLPVKLEILLETQEELDTFGTLFNASPISELFKDGGGPLRKGIRK